MFTRHRLGAVSVGLALALAAAGCQEPANGTAAPPTVTPTTSSPAATPTPTAAPPKPTAGRDVVCPKGTPKRGRAGQPVTLADLCGATLDIPSWGESDGACPHGRVRLTGAQFRKANDDRPHGLVRYVLTDVDHNGIGDAVVLIGCHLGDPPIYQVAAFARDSGNAIQTLGQVVGPVNGDINAAYDVAANADGSIRVNLSQPHGTSGSALAGIVFQWRTYRWTGNAFAQSAGSTSFDVDKSVTRLSVTASALTVAKAKGASRAAKVTVTVRNTGTATVPDVWLRPILDDFFTVLSGGTHHCTGKFDQVRCDVGDIPAGSARGVTLDLTIAEDDVEYLHENADGDPDDSVIQVRVGDQLYTTQRIRVNTL